MDNIHCVFLGQQCGIRTTIPPPFFDALHDHASCAGAITGSILLSPCSCNQYADRGMTEVEKGCVALAPNQHCSHERSQPWDQGEGGATCIQWRLYTSLMGRWPGPKLK